MVTVLSEFLEGAPWVAVTGAITSLDWVLKHRRDIRKDGIAHEETVTSVQNELTFQLFGAAREELTAARSEMEELRDEVRSLRSLEKHFFHFQQALDHIEAMLLAAPGSAERASAERAAQAFLTRMRRLQEAKGTAANEAQIIASRIEIYGDQLGENHGG